MLILFCTDSSILITIPFLRVQNTKHFMKTHGPTHFTYLQAFYAMAIWYRFLSIVRFCSFSLVDHCFTRNRKNVKLKEIRINSGWISFDCKGQGYNKVVLPLIRFAFRCKPLHFHNFWHVHHFVRSSTIAISCCPFSDTNIRFRW